MALSIYGILASRSLRPLWAAAELGLPYEHVQTDYRQGNTRTPEFLALNPNGRVPVVIDHRPAAEGGDITIWESMACALYIARHHGQADGTGITPSSPREDAEALRWSFWTMTEVEKDALTVLMHRFSMPEPQRKPELADQAERRLHVPLRVLEAHLQAQQERGESHIAADRFTVADLCAASVLLWVRATRSLMDNFPLTSAWLKGCLARPAYQALRAAGKS
jgi:glutathione S-transferase